MKCKFLSAVSLFIFFNITGCATKDPEPIKSYSLKEFSRDPLEKLYTKNGNLICAAQRLSLGSTQLVTREVNGIPESIDLSLSRFNCEKPEAKDEMCRVDIYTRMNLLTDLVNKELKTVEKKRQELRENFHQIYGDDAKPTVDFLSDLDDDKRKQCTEILEQDKTLKREALQHRREYENRIDGLEEMVYGCNY